MTPERSQRLEPIDFRAFSKTGIRRSQLLQRCDPSFSFSGRMQDNRKYLHEGPCVDQ